MDLGKEQGHCKVGDSKYIEGGVSRLSLKDFFGESVVVLLLCKKT